MDDVIPFGHITTATDRTLKIVSLFLHLPMYGTIGLKRVLRRFAY